MQALIRRDQLAVDEGAQAIEDAACLVFIETQLADVASRMEHDLLIDVLRKTARKLSPAGAAAISQLPLGPAETPCRRSPRHLSARDARQATTAGWLRGCR